MSNWNCCNLLLTTLFMLIRKGRSTNVKYQSHVQMLTAVWKWVVMSLVHWWPVLLLIWLCRTSVYTNECWSGWSIVFLTPYKVAIFGVQCDTVSKQINYLIPESAVTSKSANQVVSYLVFLFVVFCRSPSWSHSTRHSESRSWTTWTHGPWEFIPSTGVGLSAPHAVYPTAPTVNNNTLDGKGGRRKRKHHPVGDYAWAYAGRVGQNEMNGGSPHGDVHHLRRTLPGGTGYPSYLWLLIHSSVWLFVSLSVTITASVCPFWMRKVKSWQHRFNLSGIFGKGEKIGFATYRPMCKYSYVCLSFLHLYLHLDVY